MDSHETPSNAELADNLERGIAHANASGDAEVAMSVAREATRLAGQSEGYDSQRATAIADEARQVAARIRAGREAAQAAVQKDISPLSLGLVALGALLMLIAVFLPRVESNTFLRVAQNTLIQSGDGWWFIGIAVGLAGAAWLAYQKRNAGAGPFVLGLIAIGFAIYDGTNKGQLRLCPVNGAAGALGLTCSQATPSTGIYAAGVGGLLAAIGGWQLWRAPTRERQSPEVSHAGTVPPPEGGQTWAERIRTLERLRAEGLIDENEYSEQRRRLLSEI